jgi:hypothetical protein
MPKTLPAVEIESAIRVIRGQRVMMDSDLAKFYGVPTRRLNEQFRRNRRRFPVDFAFQLNAKELAGLMSQIATSNKHGGIRKLPWVFTEHGVIMLASVLKSPVAMDASVRIVRTFVRLRESFVFGLELSQRIEKAEGRLDGHDDELTRLFAAIKQLLTPPNPKTGKEIGFHTLHEDELGIGTGRAPRRTVRYPGTRRARKKTTR